MAKIYTFWRAFDQHDVANGEAMLLTRLLASRLTHSSSDKKKRDYSESSAR